jgi:hypothetical protein
MARSRTPPAEQPEKRPRFPEESNPRGHDGVPDPTPAPRPGTPSAAPQALASPAGPPSDPADQDAADATFLADRFGIPPDKSAELVAARGSSVRPDDLAATARRRVARARDPLKGVPAANEPAHEFTADADEHRLKPVLHGPNRRTGAG